MLLASVSHIGLHVNQFYWRFCFAHGRKKSTEEPVGLCNKIMDEAFEKLKKRGIQVLGVVCHVSNAQQRKDLIQKAIEVNICRNDFLFLITLSCSKNIFNLKVIGFVSKLWKDRCSCIKCCCKSNGGSHLLQTQESPFHKLWEITMKATVLLLQGSVYNVRIIVSKLLVLHRLAIP
ncbi:hypothetical protein QQP08_007361 [Theobroma cacao]|nr:hypothetical protein QQP08_007361 [Theobroma cacao]